MSKTFLVITVLGLYVFCSLEGVRAEVPPYATDADTVVLYHLDDVAGTSNPIIDSGGSNIYLIANATPFAGDTGPAGLSNAVAPISNTAKAPYRYFSDVNGFSNLFSMQQFTVEAWVRNPGEDSPVTDTFPIVSYRDSESTQSQATSIFEFGIKPSANGSPSHLSLRLPIDHSSQIYTVLSDPLVWEQNVWYHVAVSYDQGTADGPGLGSDGTVTFYRTAVSNSVAIQVGQANNLPDPIQWAPHGNFEIGTLGRHPDRILGGNIDEVRFSKIVRGTNEFLLNDQRVSDGGFEDGTVASISNWPENEIDDALDTVNPHSGLYSKRFEIVSLLNEPSLHLYKNVDVMAGERLQLRFWMRGDGANTPVKVKLRKGGSPYTTYFSALAVPESTWKKYAYEFKLSDIPDTGDIRFMFDLTEEATIWIDDMSLTSLPAVASGSPLTGNQIRNGSFEVGVDKWYAEFRETGGSNNAPAAEEANINATITSQFSANAPSGNRVLHFPVYNKAKASVTSAYFPLRYGHEVNVSFSVKASVDTYIDVFLGQGKFLDLWKREYRGCRLFANQWTTCSLNYTPDLAPAGRYYLEIVAKQPGEYEIDAVSVSEGSSGLSVAESQTNNIGWEADTSTPVANIFNRQQKAVFNILVEDYSSSQVKSLSGRVLNMLDEVVDTFSFDVALDATGRGQASITLPTTTYGGFKCEIYSANSLGQGLPETEIPYTVVRPLPPPSSVVDSFFGAHSLLTPYSLNIAEKAGFRWLRMHPPAITRWVVADDPVTGELNFPLTGVQRASQMGFKILGLFYTTPKRFRFSGAPDNSNALPGDWDAYENYVTSAATVFTPYIQHWEIWNEANSGFLIVPTGVHKWDAYLELAQHTRNAIENAGINLTLIGPAATTPKHDFWQNYLDLGGAAELDGLSFHYYYSALSEPMLTNSLDLMKSYLNRSGQPPEIWHTEGGLSGTNWLKTARLPEINTVSADVAARTVVRIASELKSMGLKRHFQYANFAHQAGRLVYRNGYQSMINVNGIPHGAIVAHANMVRFLEGASPLSSQTITASNGAKVKLLHFSKGGTSRIVAWSNRPVFASSIPELSSGLSRAYDLMGNRIGSPAGDVTLTIDPTFFRLQDGCADTDGDGLDDCFELQIGTNPNLTDSDADGLTDYQEVDFDEINFDGTINAYNPFNVINNPTGTDLDALSQDTDGDGVSDKDEFDAGTNPIDSSSFPSPTGDINNDGNINAGDLFLAYRHILGLASLTVEQIQRSDLFPATGGDGMFTLSDLILLHKLTLTAP